MEGDKLMPNMIKKMMRTGAQLLNDPTKREIIKLLIQFERLSVYQIAEKLNKYTGPISQKTTDMQRCGLVVKTRNGKNVDVTLDDNPLYTMTFMEFIKNF